MKLKLALILAGVLFVVIIVLNVYIHVLQKGKVSIVSELKAYNGHIVNQKYLEDELNRLQLWRTSGIHFSPDGNYPYAQIVVKKLRIILTEEKQTIARVNRTTNPNGVTYAYGNSYSTGTNELSIYLYIAPEVRTPESSNLQYSALLLYSVFDITQKPTTSKVADANSHFKKIMKYTGEYMENVQKDPTNKLLIKVTKK